MENSRDEVRLRWRHGVSAVAYQGEAVDAALVGRPGWALDEGVPAGQVGQAHRTEEDGVVGATRCGLGLCVG